QGILGEMARRGLRERDQLAHRPLAQRRAQLRLVEQVTPDQARVRLADLDERLARALVERARHVDALVGPSLAQDRDVQHQYTPSTTVDWKRENGRTLRTPSHGNCSVGGSRSHSSRSRKRGMKNSLVSVVRRVRPVLP